MFLAITQLNIAMSGKVGPVKPVNHTSWVAVVIPNDRPKSVRNRFVKEFFEALPVLSLCPLDISAGVGACVIGLSRISFFLSTYRFINGVLSINNQYFEHNLVQTTCFPLRFILETRQTATLLFILELIFSFLSRGTVNFILLFTTKVTISFTISQTFLS